MTLDQESVYVGEELYDISVDRGFGKVLLVEENSIEVRFSRICVRYTPEGVQHGKREKTLFWSKPLMVAPTKDEGHWLAKKQFVGSVLNATEKFKKS